MAILKKKISFLCSSLTIITLINFIFVICYLFIPSGNYDKQTKLYFLAKIYSVGSIFLVLFYNFFTSRLSDPVVKNLSSRILFTLAAAYGLMSIDTNSLFSAIKSNADPNDWIVYLFNCKLLNNHFSLSSQIDITCKSIGLILFFLMIFSIENEKVRNILLADIKKKAITSQPRDDAST